MKRIERALYWYGIKPLTWITPAILFLIIVLAWSAGVTVTKYVYGGAG